MTTTTTTTRTRMRRRALQVVATAALVVASANAFATPKPSATRMMEAAHSSSLTMIDQATENTEFDLGLGRALDTLRTDYPDMLKKRPDFTIYDADIVVVDPKGFKLNGITNYKQAFKLVQSIINVFYCPEKSLLTNRIVWDCTRNNIRVSWNAEVVPKKLFGGTKTTLHVDGISVYALNKEGKVNQHRVEHLMINDTPVVTERGIFHALSSECKSPDCSIPVFSDGTFLSEDDLFTARFTNPVVGKKSMLFDEQDKNDSTTTTTTLKSSSSSSSNDDQYPDFDWDALERKNVLRKKFGLDPIGPEEFLELEAQVQQMELPAQQQQRRSNTDAANVPSKKKGNFLGNLFGEAFENTCEYNFDCQRPEVCCDFGFKKMCCSSGAMVGQADQRIPLRIPVTKDDGYNNGW